MYKCTDADKPRLYDYISAEPEMNLFIYGDLENYTLNSGNVSAYAYPDMDNPEFIMLRYYQSTVMYSRRNDYDRGAAAEFLREKGFDCLSGKTSVVEPMKEYFPSLTFQPTFMCRRSAENVSEHGVRPLPESAAFYRATEEEAAEIEEMLAGIEEFAPSYRAEGAFENNKERARAAVREGSIICALREDGRVVSTAATSASNRISAMIVAVATLPGYRGRGYATYLIDRLCALSFAGGKRFLCLFYDNPDAGRIYRRAGFKEMGSYAMLR